MHQVFNLQSALHIDPHHVPFKLHAALPPHMAVSLRLTGIDFFFDLRPGRRSRRSLESL
jgi:hypothetical protein